MRVRATLSILSLTIWMSFSGCVKNDAPEVYTFNDKYTVTGTGGDFDVTYTNKDGNTSQSNGVSSGWSYSWTKTSRDPDIFIYLSAQNGLNYGNVTVKFYQNNELVYSNTSTGAYCIATVSE